MRPLAGRRVLVVEDEALIAMMVADMLDSAGATIIGPASSVSGACAFALREDFDAAVVDMNLRGVRSDEVLNLLIERKIPFVIASGYANVSEEFSSSAPLVRKPYVEEELIQHVVNIIGSREFNPCDRPAEERPTDA